MYVTVIESDIEKKVEIRDRKGGALMASIIQQENNFFYIGPTSQNTEREGHTVRLPLPEGYHKTIIFFNRVSQFLNRERNPAFKNWKIIPSEPIPFSEKVEALVRNIDIPDVEFVGDSGLVDSDILICQFENSDA